MNRNSGQLDKHKNASNPRSTGGNFAQTGGSAGSNASQRNDSNSSCQPVAGTDGRLLPGIMCYNCNTPGHYAGECPEPEIKRPKKNYVQKTNTY